MAENCVGIAERLQHYILPVDEGWHDAIRRNDNPPVGLTDGRDRAWHIDGTITAILGGGSYAAILARQLKRLRNLADSRALTIIGW